MTDLAPEDAKLVTLARATRARTNAHQGAAVRDLDGRTYAAASVDLQSLQLSALEGCVVMAASSGAQGLEAAVLLSSLMDGEVPGLDAVREFGGADLPVLLGDPRGDITGRA